MRHHGAARYDLLLFAGETPLPAPQCRHRRPARHEHPCAGRVRPVLLAVLLLLALLASALLPGTFYRFAFLAQLSAYAWAIIGLRLPQLAKRIPLSSVAGTFLMLNLASLLSLPASLSADSARLWKKH